MKSIKSIWMMVLLLAMPAAAVASGAAVHLDKAPVNLEDQSSLQRGAKLFASRCLACHSAASMRYNRLKDLGWSDDEIRSELELPEDVKIGSTMHAAMDASTAKLAYGVAPPDLSVISRARSADWLYSYLRSFYLDESRPSGWNNVVFPNVGMPNVLADLQGEQKLEHGEGGHGGLTLASPGSVSVEEYNGMVGDLVNYLVYMGEPAKLVRYKLGMIVLGFLAVLFVLIYALKKEIWKDVH